MNALYLLHQAGLGGRGAALDAAYGHAGKWVDDLEPVCSFTDKVHGVSVGCDEREDYMCSIGDSGDVLGRTPNDVEYLTNTLADMNVVERAGIIYHESLHASLKATGHDNCLCTGSPEGPEIMWLIWFSVNANESFNDMLRVMAADTANERMEVFGIPLNDRTANIHPRREVITWGQGWPLPTFMRDNLPKGVSPHNMSEEGCFKTFAATDQVFSWVSSPKPGVCYAWDSPRNTNTGGGSVTPPPPTSCWDICHGHNECMAKTPACR